MNEERFATCQTFCNGKFHTTSCEVRRGLLRPGKSKSKHDRGGRLLTLLRPFLFAAAGRNPKASDEEVLLQASDKFYELAVESMWLRASDSHVKAEITDVRKKIAEPKPVIKEKK